MTKNKTNKTIKDTKFRSENEDEIREFIIILIVVLLLVLGIYLVSKLIVDKRDNKSTDNTTVTGSINYNKVSVGTILNRPYDEYYVVLYDSDDMNAALYSSIISNYTIRGNIKMYYCDLSNPINSKYASSSDKGNENAKTIEEMSFGRFTLLKINNGKIAMYLEDLEKIQKELS